MSTFEDRLIDACVAQFFSPQYSMQFVWNPNTGQNEPEMLQSPSMASRIALEAFTAKREDILEAVKEKIDVDEVADRLWERIRDDLVQRLSPSYSSIWTSHDQARQTLKDEINKRIADELARRALASMDNAEFVQ